jgi:hypothetical protein
MIMKHSTMIYNGNRADYMSPEMIVVNLTPRNALLTGSPVDSSSSSESFQDESEYTSVW